MKVETRKNPYFLSLIFGDVTCNPRIIVDNFSWDFLTDKCTKENLED